MARLNSPNRQSLSREDFEKYPVWTWDDANEGHLPISEKTPSLEDYGTLFIKAYFTADGHSFDGYLIGIDTFYAFALFVNEQKVTINLNLKNELPGDIKRICEILKCKPFKLLPIHYKSPVSFKERKKVEGFLDLRSGIQSLQK